MKIIPGYRGYKKKEERRETDRVVREKAMRLLKECETNMENALESAVNAGNRPLMKIIEKAPNPPTIKIFFLILSAKLPKK